MPIVVVRRGKQFFPYLFQLAGTPEEETFELPPELQGRSRADQEQFEGLSELWTHSVIAPLARSVESAQLPQPFASIARAGVGFAAGLGGAVLGIADLFRLFVRQPGKTVAQLLQGVAQLPGIARDVAIVGRHLLAAPHPAVGTATLAQLPPTDSTRQAYERLQRIWGVMTQPDLISTGRVARTPEEEETLRALSELYKTPEGTLGAALGSIVPVLGAVGGAKRLARIVESSVRHSAARAALQGLVSSAFRRPASTLGALTGGTVYGQYAGPLARGEVEPGAALWEALTTGATVGVATRLFPPLGARPSLGRIVASAAGEAAVNVAGTLAAHAPRIAVMSAAPQQFPEALQVELGGRQLALPPEVLPETLGGILLPPAFRAMEALGPRLVPSRLRPRPPLRETTTPSTSPLHPEKLATEPFPPPTPEAVRVGELPPIEVPPIAEELLVAERLLDRPLSQVEPAEIEQVIGQIRSRDLTLDQLEKLVRQGINATLKPLAGVSEKEAAPTPIPFHLRKAALLEREVIEKATRKLLQQMYTPEELAQLQSYLSKRKLIRARAQQPLEPEEHISRTLVGKLQVGKVDDALAIINSIRAFREETLFTQAQQEAAPSQEQAPKEPGRSTPPETVEQQPIKGIPEPPQVTAPAEPLGTGAPPAEAPPQAPSTLKPPPAGRTRTTRKKKALPPLPQAAAPAEPPKAGAPPAEAPPPAPAVIELPAKGRTRAARKGKTPPPPPPPQAAAPAEPPKAGAPPTEAPPPAPAVVELPEKGRTRAARKGKTPPPPQQTTAPTEPVVPATPASEVPPPATTAVSRGRKRTQREKPVPTPPEQPSDVATPPSVPRVEEQPAPPPPVSEVVVPQPPPPAKVKKVKQVAKQAAAPRKPTKSSPPVRAAVGKKEAIVTPQGDSVPARYALVELDDLISSHDASFRARPEYPQQWQPRDYRNPAEQAKVFEQEREFEPRFLLNITPSAADGPPVITPQGHVVSGNSRVITLLRVREFRPEAYARYTELLRKQLQENPTYGISAAELENFRNPVLVRVLDESALNRLEELAVAFNRPFTAELAIEADAIDRAQRISPETIAWLADIMQQRGIDTFAELFKDDLFIREFAKQLRSDGVFTAREWSRYFDARFTPTAYGKTVLQELLTAAAIPDLRILRETGPAIRQKVSSIAPLLLQSRGRPGFWDVVPRIVEAVDIVNNSQSSRAANVVEFYAYQSVPFLDDDPLERLHSYPKISWVLAAALEARGLRSLREAFRKYIAQIPPRGYETSEALLPIEGVPKTPWEALGNLFSDELAQFRRRYKGFNLDQTPDEIRGTGLRGPSSLYTPVAASALALAIDPEKDYWGIRGEDLRRILLGLGVVGLGGLALGIFWRRPLSRQNIIAGIAHALSRAPEYDGGREVAIRAAAERMADTEIRRGIIPAEKREERIGQIIRQAHELEAEYSRGLPRSPRAQLLVSLQGLQVAARGGNRLAQRLYNALLNSEVIARTLDSSRNLEEWVRRVPKEIRDIVAREFLQLHEQILALDTTTPDEVNRVIEKRITGIRQQYGEEVARTFTEFLNLHANIQRAHVLGIAVRTGYIRVSDLQENWKASDVRQYLQLKLEWYTREAKLYKKASRNLARAVHQARRVLAQGARIRVLSPEQWATIARHIPREIWDRVAPLLAQNDEYAALLGVYKAVRQVITENRSHINNLKRLLRYYDSPAAYIPHYWEPHKYAVTVRVRFTDANPQLRVMRSREAKLREELAKTPQGSPLYEAISTELQLVTDTIRRMELEGDYITVYRVTTDDEREWSRLAESLQQRRAASENDFRRWVIRNLMKQRRRVEELQRANIQIRPESIADIRIETHREMRRISPSGRIRNALVALYRGLKTSRNIVGATPEELARTLQRLVTPTVPELLRLENVQGWTEPYVKAPWEHLEKTLRAMLGRSISRIRSSFVFEQASAIANELAQYGLYHTPAYDYVLGILDRYEIRPDAPLRVMRGDGLRVLLAARVLLFNVASAIRNIGYAVATLPLVWYRMRAGLTSGELRLSAHPITRLLVNELPAREPQDIFRILNLEEAQYVQHVEVRNKWETLQKWTYALQRLTERLNNWVAFRLGAWAYQRYTGDRDPVNTLLHGVMARRLLTGSYEWINQPGLERLARESIPLGNAVLSLMSAYRAQVEFVISTLAWALRARGAERIRDMAALGGILFLGSLLLGPQAYPILGDAWKLYVAIGDEASQDEPVLIRTGGREQWREFVRDIARALGADEKTVGLLADAATYGLLSTLTDRNLQTYSTLSEATELILFNTAQDVARNIVRLVAEGKIEPVDVAGLLNITLRRILRAYDQVATGQYKTPDGVPLGVPYHVDDAFWEILTGRPLTEWKYREITGKGSLPLSPTEKRVFIERIERLPGLSIARGLNRSQLAKLVRYAPEIFTDIRHQYILLKPYVERDIELLESFLNTPEGAQWFAREVGAGEYESRRVKEFATRLKTRIKEWYLAAAAAAVLRAYGVPVRYSPNGRTALEALGIAISRRRRQRRRIPQQEEIELLQQYIESEEE